MITGEKLTDRYKQSIGDFMQVHERIVGLAPDVRKQWMDNKILRTGWLSSTGIWNVTCVDDQKSIGGYKIDIRGGRTIYGERGLTSRRDEETGLHIVEFTKYRMGDVEPDYPSDGMERELQWNAHSTVAVDSAGNVQTWLSEANTKLEASLRNPTGHTFDTVKTLGWALLRVTM